MINNVTFGLSSIEDIRCDIDTFIEIKDGELRFQYKISVVINMSKGTITVIPEVQYRTSDEVVLSAFAAFIYDVKDIDDVISLNSESRKVEFHADILPILVNSSFSGLRGIVATHSKGTSLQKYPVPLVLSKVLVSNTGISIEQ